MHPKESPYRNKKYLEHIRNKPGLFPGTGDIVPHHTKMLSGGGTGIKPPDTHTIPLHDSDHKELHHVGEKRFFAMYGWSDGDVKEEIILNIKDYLENNNIDSDKLIIELLTKFLQDEL